MDCFSNFDRVRGWFDTEFQDSEGFTVSSTLHVHTRQKYPCFSINSLKFMYRVRL